MTVPATQITQPSQEPRKVDEQQFHNRLRDPALRNNPQEFARLHANKKYYSVTATSKGYYMQWLEKHCRDKRVLDYGCGNGEHSLAIAQLGARVVGIDISDVSVDNCRRAAEQQSLSNRAEFHVMDAENLEFPSGSFDLVCETGVLHHLDFRRAMTEVARVLTPGGSAICYEALGYNPIFQAYRRMTPHLRTPYETQHILKLRDLDVLRELFSRVEVRFFHLMVLGAVPFRNTRLFRPVLATLEACDGLLMRTPLVRNLAWVMVFVATGPRRTSVKE